MFPAGQAKDGIKLIGKSVSIERNLDMTKNLHTHNLKLFLVWGPRQHTIWAPVGPNWGPFGNAA